MTLSVVLTNAIYINTTVVVTFLKSSVVGKTKVSWGIGNLWNCDCCERLSKTKLPVPLLDMNIICSDMCPDKLNKP